MREGVISYSSWTRFFPSPPEGPTRGEGATMRPALGSSAGYAGEGARPSHPHRHQHIQRALVVAVLHQGRRAGVGELERGDVAFDLCGDVEQIAGIEADI